MSEFEDNLWRNVVHEHGDDLDQTSWPPPRRRRPRPRVLAGTTAALAAAAGALLLVLGGAGTSPAFAVTTNHDGSVTLSLRRLDAIRAANLKLSALGVRAMAVQVPAACQAAIGVARFNPHRIPAGKTLVIAAWRAGHQVRLSSARIGRGGVAACLPAVRSWTTVDRQVPITGVAARCTVAGPPVSSPATIFVGPGTGTTASTGTGTTQSTGTGTTQSTGTGTTQSTGTAQSTGTQTAASPGTGTGQSTGTGTTPTTGTGTSQSTGTGTTPTTGTGTGTTTRTGTTATPGAGPNRHTVVIPCGFRQRIRATPAQVRRAMAQAQAARKKFGKVCAVDIAPAPNAAAVPSTRSGNPPAVKIIRCHQPASKK